jgi:hypothetical protein
MPGMSLWVLQSLGALLLIAVVLFALYALSRWAHPARHRRY